MCRDATLTDQSKLGVYLSALNFVNWTPRNKSNALSSNRIGPDRKIASIKSSLSALAEKVEDCKACSLHKSRKNPVFGAGSASADWLFVGEAPGSEEDIHGLPFVGRAGQLLDAMLWALGLSREDIFIANVLKCRPPENRDPEAGEVLQCESYLHAQVRLLEPHVIVALGRFAAQCLLKSSLPIGKLRGSLHSYEPFKIPLVATYHPAYLLRSPLEKRKVWDDLVLARTVIDNTL